MRPLATLLTLVVLLSVAGTASGVIIDSGNGSGNTTAPASDPGWANVGLRGGLTAVYLGNGWVITANHVGEGPVVLGGVTYDLVPGSTVQLQNTDATYADLKMFAIYPEPPLPALPIASSVPSNGAPLILVGNGRNRGAATSWDSNGPPPPGPIDGYTWAAGTSLRWGTNFADLFPPDQVFGTEAFGSVFDEGGSDHEAQGAIGDSGGAAFAWNGSGWELAGVIIAISVYGGQPAETSLYGQITYAADLSFYRDDILDVMALPEPDGGLFAGIALVAVLARRRSARQSDAQRTPARGPTAA